MRAFKHFTKTERSRINCLVHTMLSVNGKELLQERSIGKEETWNEDDSS